MCPRSDYHRTRYESVSLASTLQTVYRLLSYQYVIKRRIERAQELMMQEQQSANIAFKVGFASRASLVDTLSASLELHQTIS